MLRSALRTMLVVSVLSGVAGSVVLLHRPGLSSAGTVLADATLTDTLLTDAIAPAEPATTPVPEPIDRTKATENQIIPPTGSLTRLSAMSAEVKVLTKRRAAEAKKRAEQARQAALERAARNAARNPKDAARLLLADRGWSGQFSCLDSLWTKESGWNYRASNPSSGAYGIPQALPGGKMSSAGADWRTNPMTQIKWGLGYIEDRYGSPCGAWSHSQASGWY